MDQVHPLGRENDYITVLRGQETFLGGHRKKENSHKLVVPANALWDNWFCDTDCLWTSETDKQRQRKTQ